MIRCIEANLSMNFSLWGKKYSRSIDSKGNYIYSHIYIDRYFKHLKKGNYCVTAASVKNKNKYYNLQ